MDVHLTTEEELRWAKTQAPRRGYANRGILVADRGSGESVPRVGIQGAETWIRRREVR